MPVDKPAIGLLHPGAMGVSVGAAALSAGSEVLWASAGRGEATKARAGDFTDCATVPAMVSAAAIIVSVCPPHAAVSTAREVAGEGFTGLFVDANAISPATTLEVANIICAAGGDFVDGGIVGPPANVAGCTRLYLSGAGAPSVANVFAGSLLEAISIGDRIGAASALKMCYAAYTKGSDALLLAIRALAAAEGVDQALEGEWQRSQPGVYQRSENAARASAPKAWRFEGEMREIAATLAAHDLPAGFHHAAADLYAALKVFKDADRPSMQAVVKRLLES
jgi:3-hydroxyisobutyrate dehydrogenase-like beta-hydroxyacid dehydrogenase